MLIPYHWIDTTRIVPKHTPDSHIRVHPPFVNMRQSDFAIGKTKARLRRFQQYGSMALTLDMSTEISLLTLHYASAARKEVQQFYRRSRHVSATRFNLNVYSEEQAFLSFRFRPCDNPRIAQAMSWNSGKTKRNRYRCDPLTACCIVLRKLATPVRLADIEVEFGMRSSALSEVFWEVVQKSNTSKRHLICGLRSELLQERAAMYADAIHSSGAPLDSCVGFIDGTKIKICRPGGASSLQRACYSGHKRMHSLVYQTITTPDGLIFSLYGPQEGRRHDLTLFRQSNIELAREEALVIDGRQFYIFGDAAYMLRP